MTQDTLIRGWALALRDLAEQGDIARVTVTFTDLTLMTYTVGRGVQITTATGRELSVPESALDDVGLVPGP